MPYITQERREALFVGPEPDAEALNGGELNYMLTLVCLDYWKRMGQRYAQINDILGALEGAKLEFYRRVAVPFEERKREANGDVYNN